MRTPLLYGLGVLLSVCGNGIAETPIEDCDGSDDFACLLPGQCILAGFPGECTCGP